MENLNFYEENKEEANPASSQYSDSDPEEVKVVA